MISAFADGIMLENRSQEELQFVKEPLGQIERVVPNSGRWSQRKKVVILDTDLIVESKELELNKGKRIS